MFDGAGEHASPTTAPTAAPATVPTTDLTVAAGRVALADPRAASNDELLERLAEVEAARRALESASARLVNELDGRNVTDDRYGTRTKDYLCVRFRHDPREAARLIRTGRALCRLDVVDAALRSGRITLEHAALLARLSNPRVAHVIRGAQAELVELAQVMRFDDWARHCRALVDLADTEGGHRPEPDDRRLHLGRGLDGIVHLSGALVGAEAANFEYLVESHADRLFRRSCIDLRASTELAVPSRAQLRADALVELVRAGAAAVTPVATAADVTLVIPVDHPALRGTTDPTAAPGDAAAGPAAGVAGTPGGCSHGCRHGAASGGLDDLAPGDLDLLLCDPVVRALVVDSLGVPLDLGHSVRFATRDQRRALAARDGGCVFPGCGAPSSWTDAHHVVRFADGGGTDLSNLASLCRHHHGVVHRRGWTMAATTGQRFTFTTPRGLVLDSQRHGRRGQDSS